MSDEPRSGGDDPIGLARIPWIAGIVLVPLTLAGTWAYVAPENVAWEAMATRAELGIRRPEEAPAPPRRPVAVASVSIACDTLSGDAGGARWDAAARTVRTTPALPGVAELHQWLDAGLASGEPSPGPPPDAVRWLLAHRAPELRELISFMDADDGVPMPMGAHARDHVHQPHLAVLAFAWMSASDGRCLEAEQAMRVAWRLAQPCSGAPSREHFRLLERTVVAARKLPRLDLGVTSRLGTEALADRISISLESEAAQCIGRAMTLDTGRARPWMIHERLRDRLDDAGMARFHVEAAREAALGARAIRAPGRCGQPLPPMAAGTAHGVVRGLDRLTVQVELTRKLAELRSLQASDGTWPERVEGIEKSACHGLSWSYVGGAQMRLEPQGPATSWLATRPGEPALEVVTR